MFKCLKKLKSAANDAVAKTEVRLIREALIAEGGNVTRAAKRLGISRKGLQLKMVKYDMREDW